MGLIQGLSQTQPTPIIICLSAKLISLISLKLIFGIQETVAQAWPKLFCLAKTRCVFIHVVNIISPTCKAEYEQPLSISCSSYHA